jgi:DNA-binding MarR family transcriptional regulator
MDEKMDSEVVPKRIGPGPGFTLMMLVLAGQFTREKLIKALEPTGLHLRHFGILTCLNFQGPLPQGVAAQIMLMDKSTAVAVIDDLEAWGYIERRRNPNDRRTYNLVVTDAGLKKVVEVSSIIDQLVKEVLGPMNEDELKTFQKPLAYILKSRNFF